MRDLSIANRPSLVLPRPCSQLVSPLRGFSQLANKTYIYFGKRNLVPLQTFSSPFVGRVGEASGSLDTPAERRPHLFGIFKSHMPSPVIPLYITKDLEVFVVEQSLPLKPISLSPRILRGFAQFHAGLPDNHVLRKERERYEELK